MVIFWRITEDEQAEKEGLARKLIVADAEVGRRRFTSDMLVNLARRNQSMLYRQLDIINQLEEKEQDPDALAELFRLDHLATRVRRNAENLLVLAGEQPPRTWSAPVPLRDIVRAAIAETEDLDRVVFAVDDGLAVAGHTAADLTHLVAELTENAVRFSPPDTAVTIRTRPDRRGDGLLLTVEDWGVGMPPEDLAGANELLARPREVDLSVSQRLGFHVVARLAARHGSTVTLNATPGSGLTAVVALPAKLFAGDSVVPGSAPPVPETLRPRGAGVGPARHAAAGPVVPVTAAGMPGAEPEAFSWPPPFAAPEPAAAGRPDGGDAGAAQAVPEQRTRESAAADEGVVAAFARPPADDRRAGPEPAPVRAAAAAPSQVRNGTAAATSPAAGWGGWWEPEPEARSAAAARPMPAIAATPAAGTPAVPPAPRPGGAAAGAPSPVPRPRATAEPPTVIRGERSLRRRVPQANLAPQLREPVAEERFEPLPEAAGAAAAAALSRYQASRRAAQHLTDGRDEEARA